MLTPEYVAGFFDGEGTVSLIYTKVRPWKRDPTRHVLGFKFVVGVSNTDRQILEMLQMQFGGDLTSAMSKNQRHTMPSYQKPVWAWKVAGSARQRHFLQTIKPHVILKASRVALGLEYLETTVLPGHRLSPEAWNKRIELFRKMRPLNRRGRDKPPRTTIPTNQPAGWNPKNRNYSDAELSEMMRHTRKCQIRKSHTA